MFFDGFILANLISKRNITRFFTRMGQNLGLFIGSDFASYFSAPKNERKDLKSHDFRSFMVAAAGLEPAASGL